MEISGFEKIISIDEFEYLSEVNQHEQCHFSCSVAENDLDNLMNKVDTECSFADGDFKFKGCIVDISFTKDISGSVLMVTAEGLSREYDRESKCRVFQDPDKKISDMLKLLSSMKNVHNRVSGEAEIPGILVQNRITDWKFAIELATSAGEFVFPGEDTFISNKGKDKGTLDENDLVSFRYGKTPEGDRLICRMLKNFDLGDTVTFKGSQLFIRKKRFFLEHCSYFYEYEFHEVKDPESEIAVINNLTLDASVINNRDEKNLGRLQLSFEHEPFEDPMQDRPCWIESESFFATRDFGAVFIPAKKDQVLVRIYNGRAVVSGSLRTDAFNQIVKGADNQYLVFDDTRYIKFDNDSSGRNTGIVLQKGKNRIEIHDEDIIVKSGDKITVKIDLNELNAKVFDSTLQLKDEFLVFNSENVVAKGKSKVSIEGEKVEIKGGKVNIKGNSGVGID